MEEKALGSPKSWSAGWRDGRQAPPVLLLLHGLGAVAFLFAGLRLHTEWRKGERVASWGLVSFGIMQAVGLLMIAAMVAFPAANAGSPASPAGFRDPAATRPSLQPERDGFWAVGDCGNDIGGGQVGYNLLYQTCNDSDELRVVGVAALGANPTRACPASATSYIQDADHGQLVCFVRVKP